MHLPSRITVTKLVSSRYPSGKRPASWDQRTSGVDVVQASDGKNIKLLSDGGQSPPRKGWVVLLTKGDEQSGFNWTLYGLT